MLGRLYVKRLTTPAGNVAHEVVAMVSEAAVLRSRREAEEARSRAFWRRVRERQRAESDAFRERVRQLDRAIVAWQRDRKAGVGR